MNIRDYLDKSFKVSMLKLFPLSMIYYLYFMVASIVMNITISPLLVGIDKTSLQINPFDVLEIMRNNLYAMGSTGLIKFIVAVSLALTLLLSIFLFMDAGNRFILLDSLINEKRKFSIKAYLFVGNVFLKRFFQMAIWFILLFFVTFLFNFALNDLSLFISKIMANMVPIFRYSLQIIVFTFIMGILVLVYIISAFLYFFLPAIVIVENCSVKVAMKKIFTIVKSFKVLMNYLVFTVIVVFITFVLSIAGMGLVSVSIVVHALYPFLFVLYMFVLIYTILLAETMTQMFYLHNRIN
ncbi:MAG: hypothetical protein GWP03_04950 [Proteobacteria bacterium]|nr:hypothetical protein [Pseudomonadota bacterium]